MFIRFLSDFYLIFYLIFDRFLLFCPIFVRFLSDFCPILPPGVGAVGPGLVSWGGGVVPGGLVLGGVPGVRGAP